MKDFEIYYCGIITGLAITIIIFFIADKCRNKN